jgi:hypothetical protein
MADTSLAFLDGQTLAVLSGASLAVTVFTNTVHALTKRSSPWIPFVASVVIVVAVALSTAPAREPMTWLLALINACLLFCTAAGIQGVIGQVAPPSETNTPNKPTSFKAQWTRPWLGRNAA